MAVMSEQYQQEYDAERAKLDAAEQSTTAPPVVEDKPAVADPKPETAEPSQEESLEQLRERVAKAEKMAKDNQAWATRLAQERAQERREREAAEREARKPSILDANPELADAIRFVASDPSSRNAEQDTQQAWRAAVEKVHPGIFGIDIDPELEKAVLKRFEALGPDVHDPLAAIREITEEKMAFDRRQLGARFAAEAAKQGKVSAMGVPGAGAGGGSRRVMPDSEQAAVDRMKNMSDADFAKEVRRVKGY